MNENHITVLRDGYSRMLPSGDLQSACTITLIRGSKNILVDTGSAWDSKLLTDALSKYSLQTSDIDYLVCTHGHGDHVGNLNLFTNALHIVGFDIQRDNVFTLHKFNENIPFEINDMIKIIPTPGHTSSDVTVIVKDAVNLGRVAVAGDLFECEEDIYKPELWKDASADIVCQEQQRRRVLRKVDYIIPGHGPMFRVLPEYMRQVSIEEIE